MFGGFYDSEMTIGSYTISPVGGGTGANTDALLVAVKSDVTAASQDPTSWASTDVLWIVSGGSDGLDGIGAITCSEDSVYGVGFFQKGSRLIGSKSATYD